MSDDDRVRRIERACRKQMAVRNATPTNCPGFGALRDKCHNPADHGAAHDYCPSCLAKWEAHRDAIAAEVLSRHDDRAHPDTRAGELVGDD